MGNKSILGFFVTMCLVVSGCTTTLKEKNISMYTNKDKHEIHFFRGLGGSIFSTGINEMADQLNKSGIPAYKHSFGANDELAKKICSSSGKKILVGHSLGGNTITNLAIKMNKLGCNVHYLVTIDPTHPKPIPGNVIVAENYVQYTTPSTQIKKEVGSSTKIRNINMIKKFPSITHITIDNHSYLQNRVLSKIKNLVRK